MLTELEINELKKFACETRKNIVKMVHNAKSGHPGGSLSAADIMAVLYNKSLNIPREWDKSADFENREESIELEHRLIKENKKDTKLLNIGCGGFSFDYINENLSFDRSEFGKKASHQYASNMREERIKDYNKNPKLCVECGRIINYDRKDNVFCSSSCSATYNNKKRSGFKCITKKCLCCGKEFTVERSSKQKFCGNKCSAVYRGNNKELTETQQILLNDIEKIKERHKTESYRKIAQDYNVSGSYIKDLLKGRICK